VRALFTEAARFQSWLDVEAALAQPQAEQGIIPDGAARGRPRSRRHSGDGDAEPADLLHWR